jgi:hypothetical protein
MRTESQYAAQIGPAIPVKKSTIPQSTLGTSLVDESDVGRKAALFVVTKNRGKFDALGVSKAWPIGHWAAHLNGFAHLYTSNTPQSTSAWMGGGGNGQGMEMWLCFVVCIFLEFFPAGFLYGIIKLRPGGQIQLLHPVPAPWTDVNKMGLVALKNVPIEMADTSYGRFLATQKRDAKRAFQHMSPAEREAFLRRLTEIDADDAKDGQSPPSNPTPV